ncbi:MAG: lysozyme inhibitor LprI family protein [Spirulinaceae cyanobacterium]
MNRILAGTSAIALTILVLSCSKSATSSTPVSETSPPETVTAEVTENPATQPPKATDNSVVSPTENTVAQAPNSVDCNNAQTQADMNYCAALDAQEADDKLNEVYQELRAAITNETQEKRLIAAQQAWIPFRDSDCEFYQRRYDGGSIMPLMYSACIADRTRQRTKELEIYLDEAQM